jgi:HEAT repeat protein
MRHAPVIPTGRGTPNMTVERNPLRNPTAPPQAAPETAPVRAALGWVSQLARTLKTCRLYDRNNPTVVRFREDLAASLIDMLRAHGAIKLSFTASDVMLGDASLYPARSREDNLALPFFRDGIRALTFTPGIEPSEVESLLDRLMRVTSRDAGEEDLVTLIWDAHLPHVDVDYVSTDGDVDSGAGGDEPEPDDAPVAPWPASTTEGAAAAAPPAGADSATTVRSDDRATGLVPGDLESEFTKIEAEADGLAARFQQEFRTEYEVSTVRATLVLMSDCLETGAGEHDRVELARFLPRVLHEAVALGLWDEARAALVLLRLCASPEWSLAAFTRELELPTSVTTSGAVAQLDQQDARGLQEFLAFASDLGETAVEWLMRVMAESQQQRGRRALAKAIAELVRANPERIAPWLADDRWYVVRNVVHILGWIGGDAIAGLLRSAAAHPEPRVRREVVAALEQVGVDQARPLLFEMLAVTDTRVFCSVLHQLSAARDAGAARRLLDLLKDSRFEARPAEEQRAIYSALGSTAEDDLIPELETELHSGNWLARKPDAHLQAIARCIARVGTDTARLALARGAASRRAPVKRACEQALAGFRSNA